MTVSNVDDLRVASSPVFSKPDFNDIRWAGVFGSFARGEQTESSDVDVLLLFKKPREDNASRPLRPLYLEDELPRVWARRVDIAYVDDDEFRGYFSIESLLCSRTIFGSARDEELLRLRSAAEQILDSGIAKFTRIRSAIQQTRSVVSKISVQVCNWSFFSKSSFYCANTLYP